MSKLIIDERLCKQVRLMMAGGANAEQIAKLVGASATTIRRIRRAGFDAETFAEMNKVRRMAEQQAREMAVAEVPETVKAEDIISAVNEEEQVPGQMRMELPEKPLTVAEAPEQVTGIQIGFDENKMMRFLASKFGEVQKEIGVTAHKIETVCDYLAQILRKMDGK